MIVITGGQSFDELADMLTIDKAYGAAIAARNNMEGADISGKKFRLTIPDNWVLAEFIGKTVTMPEAGSSISSVVKFAALAAAGYLFLKS